MSDVIAKALRAENERLRDIIDKACNALTDSIQVSGNDRLTNMHWVCKLRATLEGSKPKSIPEYIDADLAALQKWRHAAEPVVGAARWLVINRENPDSWPGEVENIANALADYDEALKQKP